MTRTPLAFAATALLVFAAPQRDVPALTERHGAFGFASANGEEIIVLHAMPNADTHRQAICGGRLVPIRFARRQQKGSASRDDAREFDRLEGTVFHVSGPRAEAQQTCLVTTDAFVENATLARVRMSPAPQACAPDARRRFGELRTRPMTECWALGEVEPDGSIGAVVYERIGTGALASLVVVSGGGAILSDFPAEYRGQGEDLWRVDDGGTFSPGGLAVPFILRRGASRYVAVEWRGSEGVSVSLFVSEGDAPARQALRDYWYRAPR